MRLMKHVPGLTLTHEGKQAFLTLNGFTAPAIIDHGSIRIARQEIPVPKRKRWWHYVAANVTAAIKASHEAFAAAKQKHEAEQVAAKLKAEAQIVANRWYQEFKAALGDRAQVTAWSDGTAQIHLSRKFTLDEAKALAAFLATLDAPAQEQVAS